MEYENTFVREVKEKNITNPADILNLYRNLYHTEDNHTEHGIVAYAINDFFADVVPRAEHEEKIAAIFEEIERTCIDSFGCFYRGATRGAYAELKKKYLPKECPNCTHFVGCEPSTIGVCDEYKEEKK